MVTGDKSEEEQAAGNALFIKVAQAYAVLSDEGSRRKYDMWVRGGRKRRPEPGDDMGPMPAYYRDDSVRDVQDTPVAFADTTRTISACSLILAAAPWSLGLQPEMCVHACMRACVHVHVYVSVYGPLHSHSRIPPTHPIHRNLTTSSAWSELKPDV